MMCLYVNNQINVWAFFLQILFSSITVKSPYTCPPVTYRGPSSGFSCDCYRWRIRQSTNYSDVNTWQEFSFCIFFFMNIEHIHLFLTICFSYMRHAYGLGEHYNSVEPLKEAASEEQEWIIGSWRAEHPHRTLCHFGQAQKWRPDTFLTLTD